MLIGEINTLEELHERMDQDDLSGFWRVSDKIYHACRAIGHSLLLKYKNSPADYKAARNGKFKDSADMLIGRALHALILEGPDAYLKRFAVVPVINKRTKEGKAQWAEFQEEYKDFEILTSEQDLLVRDIARNVEKKKICQSMLSDGYSELSCFVKADDSDVWLKCRPDRFLNNLSVVTDLKTTRAENVELFNRDIFLYGYEVQAAYYMDIIKAATGIEIQGWYCLGVEKNPPYKSYPMRLKDVAIDLGRAIYQEYLREHIECEKDGAWPAGDEDISQAEPPVWKLREWGIM